MPSGHRFDTNHASAFASSPNRCRAALRLMPLRYDFPGAPLLVLMYPTPYLIYMSIVPDYCSLEVKGFWYTNG